MRSTSSSSQAGPPGSRCRLDLRAAAPRDRVGPRRRASRPPRMAARRCRPGRPRTRPRHGGGGAGRLERSGEERRIRLDDAPSRRSFPSGATLTPRASSSECRRAGWFGRDRDPNRAPSGRRSRAAHQGEDVGPSAPYRYSELRAAVLPIGMLDELEEAPRAIGVVRVRDRARRGMSVSSGSPKISPRWGRPSSRQQASRRRRARPGVRHYACLTPATRASTDGLASPNSIGCARRRRAGSGCRRSRCRGRASGR